MQIQIALQKFTFTYPSDKAPFWLSFDSFSLYLKGGDRSKRNTKPRKEVTCPLPLGAVSALIAVRRGRGKDPEWCI
uniref:Uncharacterized protein n=1 Tax=Sander lucioperca TaxID=283035 RepID=A0A8C9Y8Y9_SANLU